MVTVEITGMAGNTHTGVCKSSSTTNEVQRQASTTIARYQKGRGITAVVIILMDLLVRFDPR